MTFCKHFHNLTILALFKEVSTLFCYDSEITALLRKTLVKLTQRATAPKGPNKVPAFTNEKSRFL